MLQTSVSYYKEVIKVHGLITLLHVKEWFKSEEVNLSECVLIESAIKETNVEYPLDLSDELLEYTQTQCIREGHGSEYLLDKVDRAGEVITEIQGESKSEYRKNLEQIKGYDRLFNSLVSSVIEKLGVSKGQAEKRVTALLESDIFDNPKLTGTAQKKKFAWFLETQID